MKTTSRIRIASITTVVIALLVVMSAVGLTFAEEVSEATPQVAVPETPVGSVQNTSQAPVQIVPEAGAPKPVGPGQRMTMVAEIASIINMKVEDVIAARHEGKSFVEIAADKGISESQLIDALIEEKMTFLDAQVAQGRMTPEQAATAISKMEENLKIALNRTEVGRPEVKPNTGLGIGRKNMSRMQPAHGRAMVGGKRGFMRGFSQGFQAGQKVGMRQGLGFGKGQGQGRPMTFPCKFSPHEREYKQVTNRDMDRCQNQRPKVGYPWRAYGFL